MSPNAIAITGTDQMERTLKTQPIIHHGLVVTLFAFCGVAQAAQQEPTAPRNLPLSGAIEQSLQRWDHPGQVDPSGYFFSRMVRPGFLGRPTSSPSNTCLAFSSKEDGTPADIEVITSTNPERHQEAIEALSKSIVAPAQLNSIKGRAIMVCYEDIPWKKSIDRVIGGSNARLHRDEKVWLSRTVGKILDGDFAGHGYFYWMLEQRDDREFVLYSKADKVKAKLLQAAQAGDLSALHGLVIAVKRDELALLESVKALLIARVDAASPELCRAVAEKYMWGGWRARDMPVQFNSCLRKLESNHLSAMLMARLAQSQIDEARLLTFSRTLLLAPANTDIRMHVGRALLGSAGHDAIDVAEEMASIKLLAARFQLEQTPYDALLAAVRQTPTDAVLAASIRGLCNGRPASPFLDQIEDTVLKSNEPGSR